MNDELERLGKALRATRPQPSVESRQQAVAAATSAFERHHQGIRREARQEGHVSGNVTSSPMHSGHNQEAIMSDERIVDIEQQISKLMAELNVLRKHRQGTPVPNYTFATLTGQATLRDLFGGHDKLLAIHNMGQGCRYCTLWGDGFNGLLDHLESALSVVMLSKDPPTVQRRFANARGWRFRLASHGGGVYMREQSVVAGQDNYPGAVVYQRQGDIILRRNACVFGPGDLYCSMWSLLGLAGLGEEDWTPQYSYWSRPETLDDGGSDVLA